MKDLTKHKKEFERIIKQYNLSKEDTAKKISIYLTKNSSNKISLEEFSKEFKIDQKDAKIFLTFIQKGLQFKEEHIDKK